jgi:hypothetical protein
MPVMELEPAEECGCLLTKALASTLRLFRIPARCREAAGASQRTWPLHEDFSIRSQPSRDHADFGVYRILSAEAVADREVTFP